MNKKNFLNFQCPYQFTLNLKIRIDPNITKVHFKFCVFIQEKHVCFFVTIINLK